MSSVVPVCCESVKEGQELLVRAKNSLHFRTTHFYFILSDFFNSTKKASSHLNSHNKLVRQEGPTLAKYSTGKMGRGKKRNTAKTGDKALYKAREELEALSAQKRKNVDDDDMYNEVDRYNNARDELQDDMLKFGQAVDSDEEAGVQNDVENVFDLGIDQSDDDDDSDSDDSSSEDDDDPGNDDGSSSDDDADDDSSIDDGMDELDEPDILNWGKRKKDYYHGDTADLEIGQEVEDAELEEEAGKEVLKARLEGMTEDDFMLDDDDDSDDDDDDDSDQEENKSGTAAGVQIMTDNLHANKRRKLSALSKREKIKLMTKTHPELMPLITHFRDEAIQPCADETLIATNALVQSDENAEVSVPYIMILCLCVF